MWTLNLKYSRTHPLPQACKEFTQGKTTLPILRGQRSTPSPPENQAAKEEEGCARAQSEREGCRL